MPGNARQHDIMLDLMRAAAAGLVMLYHLVPAASLSATGGAAGGASLWFGWIGVQVFFVVSGYVIAQSSATGGAGDFLVRRVLRLAPAAWICASITALALLATATLSPATIASRWLLALAFVPTPLAIDGVYWTLSVEAAFYLLVVAALGPLSDRARRIEWIALALGGASTAFWVVAYALADAPAGLLSSLPLRLTLLPHGALFALGIMLRQGRVRGSTPARSLATLLFLAGSLLQIDAAADRIGAEWGVTGPIVAPQLVFLAGVAAIHATARAQPWLKRLPAEAVATIGLMTYPLYLLHHVVGLTVAIELIGTGVSGWLAVAIALGAMVGLAWLVTVRVEPPLRAALARRLNRFRDPAPDRLRTASLPAG